ncbi:DegQ family serine endoprotease [Methylosarcina fibrata]|uniref:DegQ family serine endoprotease n=1 Tax=Methylosarcina fibrata TaxID=105972 RepID=UPI0003A82D7D|nr:DegQ family serine endoprotease [Methylosarcina fibrata]
MLKKLRWCLFLVILINHNAWAQVPNLPQMVKTKGAAVVNVSTTQKAPPESDKLPNDQQLPEGLPPEMEELFKHFFNGPGGDYIPRDTQSLGSGFIISQDGYVLTNHHVVKDADEIVVKLSDRRELLAKVIGSDARTDVALLKVDANDLPVVTIGSADKLEVGEPVFAIGSPFGFEQSVTDGIVSAKGRSLPGGNYVPFIQTNVAINPGNSGGPLFNKDGEVVGINSQIYSRTGGFMGLSFAIPMDVVMNVVSQLKSTGKVARGWLGVQIQDVTRELAESFGMQRPQGALVSKIIPGSPAEKADLHIGDIIIEFNGKEIETSGELPPMVGMTPINENAKLKIIRQGETKTVPIMIGLLPEQEEKLAEAQTEDKPSNKLGISVVELTGEQREALDVAKGGVLVKNVANGPAKNAGIQPGDVILRIQGTVIRNVSDFNKSVSNLPVGKSLALLVQRRGNPMFLALKIDKN